MRSYIDPAWARSMVNMDEILKQNWTRRKIVFFSAYTVVVGILLYLEFYHWSWLQRLTAAIGANLLPLAIAFFSFEPIFLLVLIIFTTYPKPRPLSSAMPQRERYAHNAEIAIIVPCHRSNDVAVQTVSACLKHVRPEQIFIVDNGNSPTPLDNTFELLQQECPLGVHYIWNPYGNKTLAQYAGLIAAEAYKYVVIMDDDVTIPEAMDFQFELIDDKVKAVCYPIRAVHPDGDQTMFIKWQEIEYKMADFAKWIQSQHSTVLFPHGAISLWERETLFKILRWHDTVFYADDVKMGMWLQRQGLEMKMASQVLVDTEAPTTFCGPAPNFYSQRVRSWDMAEHVYAYDFFQLLFTTRQGSSVRGTLIMKLFQFYSAYCIVADWCRFVVVVIGILLQWYWFLLATVSVLVLNTAILALWNWIAFRHHPERRCSWLALCSFSLYKMASMVIRCLGFLRAIVIYLPNFMAKPKITELEMKALESENLEVVPVWLSDDERFSKYRASLTFTSSSSSDDTLDNYLLLV